MYSKILIPLDGSKTAEKVLPYARYLAGKFKIPVELAGRHRHRRDGDAHGRRKSAFSRYHDRRGCTARAYLRASPIHFPAATSNARSRKAMPKTPSSSTAKRIRRC